MAYLRLKIFTQLQVQMYHPVGTYKEATEASTDNLKEENENVYDGITGMHWGNDLNRVTNVDENGFILSKGLLFGTIITNPVYNIHFT